MKNIVLIGFMGTGKSVVGKRLAKELKMRFVSTDDIIEKRERRAIAKIFEESGEPYFRNIEREVVKEASALDNVVIAAGGGVVLNEENMINLKANGTIVSLSASPQVIYERTKKYKTRPLLNVPDPVAKIKELMEARTPFYKRADYQIDTSNKTVAEIAREIICIYQRAP
jgi:shikimate kinase